MRQKEEITQNRAVLPLIEQIIMVLVFMLAAAVCIRAFVYADTLSRQSARRDQALLAAQNAAEHLKAEEGGFQARYFDENWEPAQRDTAAYEVAAAPLETEALAQGFQIYVIEVETGETLASLPIAWQQEVETDEP